MPHLPNLTPKDIIKILERNGFELDHSTGSHFIFYNLTSKKRVVVPYHTKDLPNGTLLAILKQANLSRDEIINLL